MNIDHILTYWCAFMIIFAPFIVLMSICWICVKLYQIEKLNRIKASKDEQ